MAWTTPRTWVTDELVTAALMNGHVRDNFNAVPHLIVRKTSNQSVASSTTFVNDANLQLTVAANEVWHCEFAVLMSGGPGNLKIQFTFPTGGVIGLSGGGIYDAGGALDVARFSGSTSPSNTRDFVCLGSNGVTSLPIRGVYKNGSTAGTLIMQWAQDSSSATATIVEANSTLWGCKLA